MTGLKIQVILLIFIGIYIMNKIISSIPVLLFMFILFMQHQSLAHDGEQHPESELTHKTHILNHTKKEVALANNIS